jgi:hypothetical protein
MMEKTPEQKELSELLEAQYRCTEQYCNSTTALHNALQQQQNTTDNATAMALSSSHSNETSTDNLSSIIQRQQSSLEDLQYSIRALERFVEDMSRKPDDPSQSRLLSELREHMNRTWRIQASIYNIGEGAAFHENGIPQQHQQISNDVNVKLVALAALRASIELVHTQMVLSMP